MKPAYDTQTMSASIAKDQTFQIDAADIIVLQGKSALDDTFDVSEDGGVTWRSVSVRESVIFTSGQPVHVRAVDSNMVVEIERKTLSHFLGNEGERLPIVTATTGPGGGIASPKSIMAITMEDYYALSDPDPTVAYWVLAAMSAQAYDESNNPIAPLDYEDDAGLWRAYAFTGNGSLVVSEGGTPEWWIVGGGGGGGSRIGSGGGGGAGGLRTSVVGAISGGGTSAESRFWVPPGVYPVTVGAGGAAAPAANFAQGGSGGASSIFGVVAAGGGGGGAAQNNTVVSTGRSGGSGGGGGVSTTNTNITGVEGQGTAGQGFSGGSGVWVSSSVRAGGGGGGAGGAGMSGAQALTDGTRALGGAPLSSAVTGVMTHYAAGGDGGALKGQLVRAGSANTGNGGDGVDSADGTAQQSGAGGSGIVVVRFRRFA